MARNRSEWHSELDRRAFLAGGLALGTGLTTLDLTGRGPGLAFAQTAGTPKRGGTLAAAAELDPVSLDPHTNSNFSACQAFDHIYESLTMYDESASALRM